MTNLTPESTLSVWRLAMNVLSAKCTFCGAREDLVSRPSRLPASLQFITDSDPYACRDASACMSRWKPALSLAVLRQRNMWAAL